MPRPRNPRIISAKPDITLYKPQGVPARELNTARLPYEGLEALRLVDDDGLSQAQAAERMGVSTPTLCRILGEARGIVARALNRGWAISIDGGHYRLAERPEQLPPDQPYRGSGRHGWRGGAPDRKLEDAMPKGDGQGPSDRNGAGQGQGRGMGRGRGSGGGDGRGRGGGQGPGRGKGLGRGRKNQNNQNNGG